MKSLRLPAMIYAVVCLPVVVTVVGLLLGAKWFPAGDMAQAELHMRGFFLHPPLVGAAGRIVSDTGIQGSHPGPSLWLAMLPVYLLGGRSSGALLAAAASVHLVSIAVIIGLAWKRSRLGLTLLVALVTLAVLRSAGTDFMIEPWNPWLALLPFLGFVLLVLEIVVPAASDSLPSKSERRRVLELVGCLLLASHCLQCHAGYALLVVPPACAVVLLEVRRRYRMSSVASIGERLLGVLNWIGIVSVVILLAWLPPILDEFRRKPGNLTILLQHFGSPSEPTLGLRKVSEIVSTQANIAGPWLFGPGAVSSTAVRWIGFLMFACAFLAAMWVSKRRQRREHFRCLLILGIFMCLGVLSIARIFGPYFEYTIRWFWLLTGTSLAFVVWTFLSLSSPRIVLGRVRRIAIKQFPLAVLIVLSAVTVGQSLERMKLPGATDSRIIGGLIDETQLHIDQRHTYQVRFYDPYTLNATGFGMVLELERRGYHVKVDPEYAAAALPHRTAPMNQTDGVLWIVVGPAVERADHDPSLKRIAWFNPRTAEQQRRSVVLLQEVAAGLKEAGRSDLVSSLDSPGASILFAVPPLPLETARLVRELIRMGQPTAVYLMSPDAVAHSLE